MRSWEQRRAATGPDPGRRASLAGHKSRQRARREMSVLSFRCSCFSLNHDHPILKDGDLRYFPCAVGIRRDVADRLLTPVRGIKEERFMHAAFQLVEDCRFGERGAE